MKLKALELFGFKSFAERTVFDLDSGMTAVVGPNGCGKSNTIDAVKWVLGEQSARSLRGREMMDVIFNGTDRRPAAGMAEVTLVFDNEDRTLDRDDVEVSVSRRLYRSGESEYLINGSNCRLRDVRDLFMGTGLGPGGYAFMEQGKIDSVLASNPTERRRVFEEAAGISRYRARRHEAELKLDKVDANLLRLADIIDELERQERSLKIQAGKARNYKDLQQQVRTLQAQVALHHFDRNDTQATELKRQFDAEHERRQEMIETRDASREEASVVEVELKRVSDGLAQVREKAVELNAAQSAAREMVAFQEKHLETLERQATGRTDEIAELAEDVKRAHAEEATALKKVDELQVEAKRLGEELSVVESTVDGLKTQWEFAESSFNDAGSTLQQLREEHAQSEQKRSRRETSQQHWTEREAEAASRLDALNKELKDSTDQLFALEKSLEAERTQATADHCRLAEARKVLEEVVTENRSSEERRRGLDSNSSRLKARCEVLQSHVDRGEGLAEGVRAVLEQHEGDSQFLPGFRGVLLDLIRVDRSQAALVEGALGELLQAIVVQTTDEALKGCQFMRERGKGRVIFVALDGFSPQSTSLPDGVDTSDAQVRCVLQELLGGLEVVEENEVRDRMARGTLNGTLVTSDGETIRDGRLFATQPGGGDSGLVAVRSELVELAAKADAALVAVEGIDAELVALKAREVEAIDALEMASESCLQGDASVARGEQEIVVHSGQMERLQRESKSLEGTRQQAAKELQALTLEASSESEQLSLFQATMTQADEQFGAADLSRADIKSRLDVAAAHRESMRLQTVTAEQQLHSQRSSLRHLKDRHENATATIGRYESELEGFAEDRETSLDRLKEARTRSEGFESTNETIQAEIAVWNEKVEGVQTRHAEVIRAQRELETTYESASESVHALEMRLNEVRVNQQNLVDHIREDLELDLAELHQEYTPEDVDWASIEEKLEALRDRLRRIGNVNLSAIDDLKLVQERLEFLLAQRADLHHSRGQLHKVLDDIERESTRLFLETFNAVREHFQVTFRKLFGGGRADISLVDEENVLESGIEIMARPPGSKLQSITLLSGGQRTMTAVALLFSIIRAHPCPCCLLDEVDAALDEDNTERFCAMLSEFVDKTQFLLITHRRRTMAMSDVLFGVTMAERGVSRHVGVRVEDVGEEGAISQEAEAKRPLEAVTRGQRKAKSRGPSRVGSGNLRRDVMKGASEVVVEINEAATSDADGGAVSPPDVGEEVDRSVRHGKSSESEACS